MELTFGEPISPEKQFVINLCGSCKTAHFQLTVSTGWTPKRHKMAIKSLCSLDSCEKSLTKSKGEHLLSFSWFLWADNGILDWHTVQWSRHYRVSEHPEMKGEKLLPIKKAQNKIQDTRYISQCQQDAPKVLRFQIKVAICVSHLTIGDCRIKQWLVVNQ